VNRSLVTKLSLQIAVGTAIAIGGMGCGHGLTGGAPATHVRAPRTEPAPVPAARTAEVPGSPAAPAVRVSVETREQIPCTQDAIDASGLREQLSALDDQIGAIGDDADITTVRALSEALHNATKSYCFRLMPSAEIPYGSMTAASLRWFWVHGGRDWAMQVLRDDPASRVMPPPVPSSLRLETLPPPQRMFLCHEAACAMDTAAWRIRAERTINAIGQGPRYTARRPCRRAMRVPGWSEFDLELECEAAEAGLTWVLPLGTITAAKVGVLTTTASRRNCQEWRAFDISSGRSAWLSRCGDGAFRIGLGRVDSYLLREGVFAFFVAPYVTRGPSAATIDVPPAIRPLSTLGEFPAGVDGSAMGSSRSVEHSLVYWRNNAQVLSGKVIWPQDFTFAERVYLVWQLDAVDASWRGDCSAQREYRTLSNALALAFPVLSDALAPLRVGKHFSCETTPLQRLGAENP